MYLCMHNINYFKISQQRILNNIFLYTTNWTMNITYISKNLKLEENKNRLFNIYIIIIIIILNYMMRIN